MTAQPALAQSAPPAPAARPAPPPPPGYDAAQKAFDALPETDRKALQDALTWTGDFSAVTSGQFGLRTFSALQAWQKRGNQPADGILDAPARAAVIAAAARLREAVRFGAITDAATGARIALPARILDKTAPRGSGTRFASADGKVTLDTAAPKAGETDLPRLFETLTAPDPKRKITYRFQRPDFFVVTGEAEGRKYYQRFALSADGAVRGFTFAYPLARAAELDKMTVAIANSFEPFPVSGSPVTAAAPYTGTALVIAAGRAVTSASAAECEALFAGGAPARRIRIAGGAALIEVGSGVGRPAPGLATPGLATPGLATPGLAPAAPAGTEAVVLAFAPEAGRPALQVIGASVTPGGRIVAALTRTGTGGPVFDRSGGLVGLVGAIPREPVVVAGVAPQASYPVVAAGEVLALVQEGGGAAASSASAGAAALTSGAMVARFAASLVAVECRR